MERCAWAKADLVTEAMYIIVRIGGHAVIFACLVVVVSKVIWNVGLPYAMLLALRRGVRRGWSVFLGVEFLPLLIAIVVSYLVSGHGVFSPRTLAVWGAAAILGSYAHMGIVSAAYTLYCRFRRDGREK